MAKIRTSILIIVILIIINLLMGGALYFCGRIGNHDVYDAVQGSSRQMQEQVDRRSDAIEAKLDRLDAKLDAVHGLTSRADAQTARIESKLDTLINLMQKQQPAQMEPVR